ncbi:hypothetical protein, variant 3 [Exophiala mesophila]|uniref:Uncharacterized protein n=1 Tax=Exophiala mesophila TaxID=212818 RepID=A0A0D1WV70_EXOME|nr:hypothetical protein, variant 2 [Exophiala mesophila]XP_016224800.1 hypothetical protein, variant 3 [Exophiala mesophila]KIV93225.1 hypothetical protein, variant 2 [Exophiala mesophila]KIV93226.1 hypothetical protein, variant 3 [Exophiala mesophila]
MATRFLVFIVILCFVQTIFAQTLSLSQCAIQCTTQVTTQSSSCPDGLQCFCADQPLFQLGIDCWKENCTIREGLVARNITSLQCNIPDRDRGQAGTAITFASMSVALVFVAMQIIVFTTMRHWGWDDILMVIATVLMVLNAAANPVARTYGFGRDVWRLPFNHTSTVMKIFYIGGIIYAVAVAMTKMAFLCFYIRLFPRSTLQKWAYPILVITFIQGTIFTFLFIFQCSPISYAWTSWDGESEGKCLNFDVGAVLHSIFNIVLDFIIFFLPMRQMFQLNLSQKKRVQVLLMFAVGFL